MEIIIGIAVVVVVAGVIVHRRRKSKKSNVGRNRNDGQR